MATWNNLNLQNSSSPLMEQLIYFHDHSLLILILTTILVSYLMYSMLLNKFNNMLFLSGQFIEIIWTVLPSIILLFLALPSLRLLYMLDESYESSITLKAIGHQWYWSYEYSNFKNIEFDSYMNQNNKIDNFRLLDTDNNIVLPFNFQNRILVTATDVIHSWTIPSLGSKVDAIPGRLNQTNFFLNRPGIYFGQCSEICGANHSFMPITLESTSLKFFTKWLINQ